MPPASAEQPSTAPAVEFKDFAAEYQVKTDDDGRRRLIGYASTFGNVDEVGDRVESGAYTKTLGERAGRLPYLFSHDPVRPIGAIDRWTTDTKGLLTEARMAKGALAEEVVGWVEDGILGGQSIGYKALKYTWDGPVRVLRELKLFEVSAVVLPANTEAVFLAAKAAAIASSAAGAQALPGGDVDDLQRALWDAEALATLVKELKEGRRFSAASLEKLRAAHGALADLIAAAEPVQDESEEDEPKSHSALRLEQEARIRRASRSALVNRARLAGAAL